MASSNKTGLGINKKRSKQVLKTSIDVLQEYSKWAKDEDEDSYLAMKDLHTIVSVSYTHLTLPTICSV